MLNSFNPGTVTLDHSVKKKLHKRALNFLSLTVFVLMAFPRLRLTVGPVPLYAIDLLILLTAYHARPIRLVRRSSLQPFIVFILIAAYVSELIAGLRMGTLLKPIYAISRTLLAGSLFFSTRKIIQSKGDLQAIIRASLPGAMITATLLILTSLPQTRSLVFRYVFSLSFLEPASDSVITRYDFYQGGAGRGRSLIGVSILSGAFLNTIWPLLFLLRTDRKVGIKWRISLTLASILIPIAVVMTYSRGAIFGLLLIIITVAFFNSGKVRQAIVLGVGLTLLIFFWVGWDSEYFYFERLEHSTESLLDNPYDNGSETERIFAYSEPFQHVMENPIFLLIGQGFARWDVTGHNLLAGKYAATHAVFAAAYYGYGMLAACAYMLLLLQGFRITRRFILRPGNSFLSRYSRALLAGLMGFLGWFLFGHAAVSEPRGAMFLFFVFGLVEVQHNLSESHGVIPRIRPITVGKHAKDLNS